MKTWMTLITAFTVALFTGCGGGGSAPHSEGGGHDHGGHDAHGPNGGELLEVGDHLAHIELIHSTDSKSMTLNMLGPDAKTALTLGEAPVLNITVDGTAVQVPLEGSDASFTATHEAFAGEPEGRISIKMAGKTWQVPLTHHHDHGSDVPHDHDGDGVPDHGPGEHDDHAGHEHDGHDHGDHKDHDHDGDGHADHPEGEHK